MVIQYGLADRLLFDRIENLMFADPAPSRLDHEHFPPTSRPPH
ncbi:MULTISPECIES: hypothetical protein [unclassified Streptomyces]|nr:MULTISPECIES: hypothetical protein [unclassified Streptomyces]MCX5327913.1 hypothetical protein [Streptomyces sp. NBC_00140]MCX5357402.1 hypothetical protein [Streptomyces sp. NBC_00124]